MKKNIIYFVLAIIVVGAGAFYGGIKYASGQSQANVFAGRGGSSQYAGRGTGATGAGGAGFSGRGGAAGNLASGQIISMDDKSVTIQLRNGNTQFIFFSPTTQILKSTTGTTSDLQKGLNVSATGTTNSDGSVTASMIQIRPAMTPNSTSGATGAQGTNAAGSQPVANQ